jgi:cytochrome b
MNAPAPTSETPKATLMLPQHHTGHNSGGALAIVGLLGRALATVALGWASETARLPALLTGRKLGEADEANDKD